MKIGYKTVISLLGAIALILQNFGLRIEGVLINEIITGIAGVLVGVGIVAPKEKKKEANCEEKTE